MEELALNTLWFILPTLLLALAQSGLLACIMRRLVAKYLGNEQNQAGKLEIGTMDILPLLFSFLLVVSLLVSYLAILALLKLWAVILFVVLLAVPSLMLCHKMLGILKKLK